METMRCTYIIAIMSFLASATFAAPTEAYACDSTYDISDKFSKLAVPIIQSTSFYNVSKWNNDTNTLESHAVPYNVSGTMTMLDACSFQVTSFTFSPFIQTVWYGRESGNYTVGGQVSHWSILESDNKEHLHYQLMDGKTFAQFDTIILFSTEYNLQLAYAQFPRVVARKPAATGTTSNTSNNSNNNSNNSNNTSNNNNNSGRNSTNVTFDDVPASSSSRMTTTPGMSPILVIVLSLVYMMFF